MTAAAATSNCPSSFVRQERPFVAAAKLDQIVDRADGGQPERDHQGDLDEPVRQIAEDDQSGDQSGHEEQTAHGRRRLLRLVQTPQFGRVASDWLAEVPAEPADQAWSESQREEETRHRGQRAAERDLGQRRPCRFRETFDQPEEHGGAAGEGRREGTKMTNDQARMTKTRKPVDAWVIGIWSLVIPRKYP